MSSNSQTPTTPLLQQPPAPDFIDPANLDAYDDDEAEAMIEAIRARRLHALHVYEQSQREAAEMKHEKDAAALTEQCRMLSKDIERTGKALDALEKRVNRIRALRLQLGMEM